MIRKLFEALSLFDWITPTIAMIEDIAEGGPLNLDAWCFFIPNDEAIRKGWSGAHIEELMKHRGIRTWSRLVNFGEYSFIVSLEQAAYAEYVLTMYGIPIKPRSQGAPRPKPKGQDNQTGWRQLLNILEE